MFTSLRSRLWLSYVFVIAVALTIVAVVLLVFLLRNPVLSRQTQQQLKTVQSLIAAEPDGVLTDPVALERITQEYEVRVLVFDQARTLLLDSKPNDAVLPYPRRNILGRNSQTAVDG